METREFIKYKTNNSKNGFDFLNKSPLYKTNYCRNVEKDGYCNRKDCNFYHSVEERRIPLCTFDNNCKNKSCKFFHEHYENEKSWLARINKVYPLNVPLTYKNDNKNIVLKCKKEMAFKNLEDSLNNGYTSITIIIE